MSKISVKQAVAACEAAKRECLHYHELQKQFEETGKSIDGELDEMEESNRRLEETLKKIQGVK